VVNSQQAPRDIVRFEDEWEEPQAEDDNPRWFTAVYAGISSTSVERGTPEGYWDVDGVSRWQYGTTELVIGDPTDDPLWPPLPATRDRTVTAPARR
jgi:hypothetical protein